MHDERQRGAECQRMAAGASPFRELTSGIPRDDRRNAASSLREFHGGDTAGEHGDIRMTTWSGDTPGLREQNAHVGAFAAEY